MNFFQALFIAIVQGATELFPVSSLGHAVIIPRILNWDMDEGSLEFLPFLVVLHLGTAVALLAYFWRDWLGFAHAVLGKGPNVAQERRTFFLVCVATIPAALIGFVFEHKLRDLFSSPMLVACFLIVNGGILFAAERIKHKGTKNLAEIDWLDALLIGATQALALFPGISRSGSTMVGGVVAGLTHKESARFSFLLATPIILGASAHQIPKLHHVVHIPGMPGSIDTSSIWIGGIVAGLIAYASVWFLMRYFKKNEFDALNPFAYYCWGFGALSLIIMALT
jgi:undecaprenyl-diphosphatase